MRDSAAAGDGCVSPQAFRQHFTYRWCKQSFMTEGAFVSSWHPPQKQTERCFAECSLRIAADCLCESDHGLNWTSAGAIYSHLSGKPARQFGFLR